MRRALVVLARVSACAQNGAPRRSLSRQLAVLLAVPLLAVACGDEKVPRDLPASTPDAAAEGAKIVDAGCGPSAATAAAWSDWPSFSRDAKNSRFNADEKTLVAATVGKLALTWSAETSGQTGTPAAVDGVLYTGDAVGNIEARDAQSGCLIWQESLERTITSSPLVTDTLVVVSDGKGYLTALARRDGSQVWQTQVDSHPNVFLFSSPILAETTIVTGVASTELNGLKDDYTFRGSIVGLEQTSGKELWRFYVTQNDATSGAGVSVWSSAAVDTVRKTLYIGTGQTYEEPASPYADGVVAIDYTNGALRWHRQFTKDDVYTILKPLPKGPDADVGAAPNLFSIGARDVVGAGDKAGVYSVLDRDTGETVWARQLTEGSSLGGVMVAAAYDGEALYLASNQWVQEMGQIGADFKDANNKTHVFALNPADGTNRWEIVVDTPTLGGVTVAGGVAYTSSADGMLRGLSTKDGSELWKYKLEHGTASGHTVANGYLFVGDGFDFFAALANTPVPGKLYAFKLP